MKQYKLDFSADAEQKARWRKASLKYYEAHPEQQCETNRKWRKAHPEHQKATQAAYRAAHPEKIKGLRKPELQDGYRSTYLTKPRNRMRFLVRGAQRRAAAKGVSFDPQIRETLMNHPPEFCACCEKHLDYSLGRGTDTCDSPSIDRFVPRLGYVLGNIDVLCTRCNYLKRDATAEELQVVVDYMRSRL